jgi:hypothetical protein
MFTAARDLLPIKQLALTVMHKEFRETLLIAVLALPILLPFYVAYRTRPSG